MSEIAGRPPIILWFRDDLRVSDHLALLAASSEPVVPLFILDTENPVARSPAAARRWWLEGSLAALDSDLAALGSRLILRRGDPLDILLEVIGQAGATRVFVTRAHEPRLVAEETAIGSALARRRVSLHGFDGALLSDPRPSGPAQANRSADSRSSPAASRRQAPSAIACRRRGGCCRLLAGRPASD